MNNIYYLTPKAKHLLSDKATRMRVAIAMGRTESSMYQYLRGNGEKIANHRNAIDILADITNTAVSDLIVRFNGQSVTEQIKF